MIRIPTHRRPTHPGEMLLKELLNPIGLTQPEPADAIHFPYQRVNDIVNGRRSVTPGTALHLRSFIQHVRRFLDQSPGAVGYVIYSTGREVSFENYSTITHCIVKAVDFTKTPSICTQARFCSLT